jgi:hypothetical protein
MTARRIPSSKIVPATTNSSLRSGLVAALAVTAACLACAGGRDEVRADLVLTNGTVVTLDHGRPEARAVAIRGGIIAAVGSNEDVARLAGPSTRWIDVKGGMVLPGLIDAHGHIHSLGDTLANLDLRGVDSVEEIARRVAARTKDLPAGAWVYGDGWDQNLWPGKAFPDHRPLDAASPGRPVWLDRVDGHAGWANLAAMKAAGVVRDTRNPDGGVIERDAQGNPTGVFIDNAQDLVLKARPKPSRDQIKEAILTALRRCAEGGLTEVHDAAVSEEEAAAFRELADEGKLPLRVYLMWNGIGDGPLEAMVEQPPLVNYKNRLTLRAVKLMIDGAMGSRGAVFFDDYADDRGNRGLLVTPPEEIERRTELAMRKGYQVCTHAIGDRGIRLTIDAYQKALQAVKPADPRPRIEHLQCVAREDVPRLKSLGIIASMQPSHATSDMYWADDRVGPERGRGLYAWRWVLDAGVVIAAGSDFPVDPERPLVGIHSGVTRQDLKNWPEGGWHPEQKMTLDEVLRAYTWGAAYAAYEEKTKGRIAPGYWADLTVLRKDLRAIPAAEIPAAGVAYTIVGGQVAYAAR